MYIHVEMCHRMAFYSMADYIYRWSLILYSDAILFLVCANTYLDVYMMKLPTKSFFTCIPIINQCMPLSSIYLQLREEDIDYIKLILLAQKLSHNVCTRTADESQDSVSQFEVRRLSIGFSPDIKSEKHPCPSLDCKTERTNF